MTNDNKLTPSEKQEMEQMRKQEGEIKKQMEFQMGMYGDKRNVEMISMLITVLKEIQFKDPKIEEKLENKLYNKIMEFTEPSKSKSDLIK